MGSKRFALLAALVVVGTLAFAPNALAWTFSASGSVKCDTMTGQQVVTWTLDNRTEPETLTVRASDRAAVPVGSTVAKYATGDFTERLAGSTTGNVTLNVNGNWPSDQSQRARTATVTLAAACTPPDVCPNIDGIQATVPAGLQKEASGKCVPIDVCPNVDGIQATVPAGLQKDASGKCVPIDVCPNVDGVQATVPSGLVKDSAGNCLPPPPTDVCTNIEGIQTVTPSGMTNQNGVCDCPPQIVTVEKVVEKTVTVPVETVVEKVVPAAPLVITKTKIIVKKVVVKPKKKKVKIHVKGARHTFKKPGVLPFTP